MREERAPKWTIVSHLQNYGKSFYNMASLIFEMQEEYWLLSASEEKVRDVMNMPSYIVEDWLWLNRQVIDDKTIENHIERAEADVKNEIVKHQSLMKGPISHVINEKRSEKDITDAEEKLAILLSIRRSIKIGKIIP